MAVELDNSLQATTPSLASKRFVSLRAAFPGLLAASTITLAATWLALHYSAPAILFALLLGIGFNWLHEDGRCTPGLNFAAKHILRIGVALLGARLTFEQIFGLGFNVTFAVSVCVATTIFLGAVLARRLGLPLQFGLLSGSSVAICGASAALAVASVLPNQPGKHHDTIVVIIAVTTLSTIAMLVYPVLGTWLGLNERQIGIFLGGSIHDVAQVIGAGYLISPAAGDIAAVVKLFRVALLVPVTIVMMFLFIRPTSQGLGQVAATFPMFLLGFVAITAANTAHVIPTQFLQMLQEVSRWCITLAIAALGTKTSFADLRHLGWRPIMLIIVETAWIAASILLVIFRLS